MATRNADSSQGDGGPTSAPSGPTSRPGNVVFKSGPLFISSKGIGWTSWKKRWFVLTRTSLVFFRSDPSLVSQKGSEVNLTLGGIDLNNSGSVVVRADKKLLTVLFPDGRDGRTFTLKAETTEDLYEWKAALENALSQAPSATMGQNGIFRNDPADSVDGEQGKDRNPAKSSVIGRPVLFALEDVDGTPSFLEKALQFIEEHGVKVEGILRQAADVDDVERRIQEYEQGKTEFSPDEDAHVIGDCIKYILREIPSYPVPASCCNALLDACRTEPGAKVDAMREAICNTFPEPNRRLLQRILTMMQRVASHKSENRMSLSAVAACMAPLLLRPLLAGDCELESDFSLGGDGSVQLMQAAAAANHAQAIVITLLEEYDNIFEDDQLEDGSISSELYSDMEDGSDYEEQSDDDGTVEDGGFHDSQHGNREDDPEHASSETSSEHSSNGDDKVSEGSELHSKPSLSSEYLEVQQKTSNGPQDSLPKHDNVQSSDNLQNSSNTSAVVHADSESLEDIPALNAINESIDHSHSSITKTQNKQNETVLGSKRRTLFGRTPARKNVSMESFDYVIEDEEIVIQRLEDTKTELQNKIAKEAKENAILQESLERRKKALHERRLALEQDVARLQEQLQRERDLRASLEAGLDKPMGHSNVSVNLDKMKVADPLVQLNQQEQNHGSVSGSCYEHQLASNHQASLTGRQKDAEMQETEHLHERSTKSEDTDLVRTDSSNMKIQGLPSVTNKQLPQMVKLDSASSSNTKSVGVPSTSSTIGPHVAGNAASSNPKKSRANDENINMVGEDCDNMKSQDLPSSSNKQQPQKHQLDTTIQNSIKSIGAFGSSIGDVIGSIASNAKKSGARGELQQVIVPASNALTKLTTRLNFLKERRIQIANELKILEKSQGSEGQPLGPPKTNPR
ncbi:PREDICTED: rho GTPase-activating protein REN1-like isoform X2 [Nelumbo nucifera]|uniref:Rho GTPase-activating protein REN1-like n=2 Tax=Nelumbo nucifera TaxID=4432 RepID=A0A822XXF3_NELNU|nr:PREDICTED: rho GTPase-activating protein REN1-like isoform X2 [Nelumbo nucifera]DAD22078.1 TPA_asm: hypothetical protein HUJ06_023541 [Nelumbo nucifera]